MLVRVRCVIELQGEFLLRESDIEYEWLIAVSKQDWGLIRPRASL